MRPGVARAEHVAGVVVARALPSAAQGAGSMEVVGGVAWAAHRAWAQQVGRWWECASSITRSARKNVLQDDRRAAREPDGRSALPHFEHIAPNCKTHPRRAPAAKRYPAECLQCRSRA
jgi:hypothetical protein